MKFMIMVFAARTDLQAKPPEWVERMAAFMVRLDDELAHRGELVYSEVLEYGDSATMVDRHGRTHHASFSGSSEPLSRFWVVKVPTESRALEIAASVAEVVDTAVEVRRCMEQYLRP